MRGQLLWTDLRIYRGAEPVQAFQNNCPVAAGALLVGWNCTGFQYRQAGDDARYRSAGKLYDHVGKMVSDPAVSDAGQLQDILVFQRVYRCIFSGTFSEQGNAQLFRKGGRGGAGHTLCCFYGTFRKK